MEGGAILDDCDRRLSPAYGRHVIFSLVLLESLHYWLQKVAVVMPVQWALEGVVGLADQEQLYHETPLNLHLQVFQCISTSWGNTLTLFTSISGLFSR